jgi:hypothetical protein
VIFLEGPVFFDDPMFGFLTLTITLASCSILNARCTGPSVSLSGYQNTKQKQQENSICVCV